MTELPLAEIHVRRRVRRELGDVRSLAESIRSIGLLHPIVVDGNGHLIAGQRRLAAVKLLGWTRAPVTVALTLDDALGALRAERDENAEREPLRPSEAVALAAALEPLERAEARKRQEEGQEQGRRVQRGELVGADSTPTNRAKARDRIAEAAGMSHPRLAQARGVVEAAEADPEAYGDLPKQMDATGNVNRAFRDLRARQKAAAKTAAQKAVSGARRHSLKTVCDLRTCSCRELFASGIRPDAVITDPPYAEEFLSVFSELAATCRDVPLVAVMSGQSYLPEVMHRLCEHLHYRWTLAYLTPGGQAVQQWQAKVNTFWKPVLLFGEASEWLGDVAASKVNDNDKEHHHWGQSESGMADLVERLTKPGQLICDPFLGGGTTAAVSLALGRRFVGCDVDEECVAVVRARMEHE